MTKEQVDKLGEFSPDSWIWEARCAGMSPKALVFADGVRKLGILEGRSEPVALNDRQREWVLAVLIAQGSVVEVPLPYRETPPSSDKFDPVAWVREAIYAGADPIAWIKDDGSRGLWENVAGAIHYLKPASPRGDDLRLALDELIRMGRWETTRAIAPGLSETPGAETQ